jgi:hypothetical protein
MISLITVKYYVSTYNLLTILIETNIIRKGRLNVDNIEDTPKNAILDVWLI